MHGTLEYHHEGHDEHELHNESSGSGETHELHNESSGEEEHLACSGMHNETQELCCYIYEHLIEYLISPPTEETMCHACGLFEDAEHFHTETPFHCPEPDRVSCPGTVVLGTNETGCITYSCVTTTTPTASAKHDDELSLGVWVLVIVGSALVTIIVIFLGAVCKVYLCHPKHRIIRDINPNPVFVTTHNEDDDILYGDNSLDIDV